MIVTVKTTIAALAKHERISERALNVCQLAGIITLGDLFGRSEEEISSLRNCGKKTIGELKDLVVKYGHLADDKSIYTRQFELSFPTNEEMAVESLSAALDDVIHGEKLPSPFLLMIGSTKEAAQRVVKGQFNYVQTLRNLSVEEWVIAVKMWLEVMERWAEHPSLRPDERSAVRSHASKVGAFWDESVLLRAYVDLPCSLRELWQSAYERLYFTMSVRARNVFSFFSRFESLLPCFNGMLVIKPHNIKNCGRKSFEEFEAFMERVKENYLEFVAHMANDNRSHYEHQMRVEQLLLDYPFLVPSDASVLATMLMKGVEMPMFYLLERYIEHGTTNAAVVYRELYGLGGRKPKSLVEIAHDLNVTRERVRQLASTALTLPRSLESLARDVAYLFSGMVISEHDPIWGSVLVGDMKISSYQLMGLCTAIDNSYCIVRPSGGKHIYLVKRRLLNNVRVMNTVSELVRKVELRSMTPMKINVADFIYGGRDRGDFDKYVMELMPIFVEYFDDNPRVEFDGKDTLVVRPNLIDVPREIENILAANGKMMSALELQKAFNDAFPDHVIESMGSFRAQIYRSRLVPVGRSGNYVLPTWKGTYTGKLVDYLEVILKDSDRPLSIEELTERARRSYPNTTSKSIATLVGFDTHERFCQFKGFYYGLKDREYDNEVYKIRHIVRRFTFEERMEQLKQFVAAHQRLPMVFPDQEEASLNRWMKNVEGKHVTITPHQRAAFNAFMATVTTIPHSKPELAFYKSCNQLRDAIEGGDDLNVPPAATLWMWACRMFPLRGTWGDNRDKYFEQLLDFMHSRGIRLDASPKRAGTKRKD